MKNISFIVAVTFEIKQMSGWWRRQRYSKDLYGEWDDNTNPDEIK